MISSNTKIEGEEKQKILEVYPISKSKRVALYFCDAVITFIFSFFFFFAATMPITKAAINYDGMVKDIQKIEIERNNILKQNGLLTYEKETDDIDELLASTFDNYLKYYVYEDESLKNNEVIIHYYKDIKKSDDYIKLYQEKNKNTNFLNIDETNKIITLKTLYIGEFKPYFVKKEDLSEQAKTDLSNFKDKIFTAMYSDVLYDIEKNDLVYIDSSGVKHSYMDCQNRIYSIEKRWDAIVVINAYSAFIIGSLITYALVPAINKRRRTISMMFMRINTVDINTLLIRRKTFIPISYTYSAVTNLWIAFFLPIGTVDFVHLFALPSLFPIGLVSIAFSLVGLFFVLFGQYNRSISDVLTKSITISEDSLDDVYEVKGLIK